MLFERQKRAISPILFALLASTSTVCSPSLSLARQSKLEKLQGCETSIVTVKAQTFTTSDTQEKPKAALSPAGQIIILNNERVGILEKTGAGLIVSPDGMIATNTHVIYGSQLIKVVLNDQSELPAAVLFVSPQYDFSLIKVNAGHALTPVEWSDPDKVELGQEIITIGHSPLLNKTISGGKVVGLGTKTAGSWAW